ncbi:MAG: hypothetical protein ABL921_29905, partial [Pirellula sp.]
PCQLNLVRDWTKSFIEPLDFIQRPSRGNILLPSPRNFVRSLSFHGDRSYFEEWGRTTHRRKVDWMRQLDVEL